MCEGFIRVLFSLFYCNLSAFVIIAPSFASADNARVLLGKVAGKPCWQLLLDPGVTPPQHIRPYASLQPSGATLPHYTASLVEWATRAKDLGFTAAKLEATLTGPYAHEGMSDDSTAAVTSIVAAVRAAVGPDFTLMVDVQYAFDSADRVSGMVADWDALGLNV